MYSRKTNHSRQFTFLFMFNVNYCQLIFEKGTIEEKMIPNHTLITQQTIFIR